MKPLSPLAAALLAAATGSVPGSPTPQTASSVPAIDLSALDRSVDPCDDFYSFACGGWLARAEIPADRPIWGRGLLEMEQRNLSELRQILEADAAGKGDPKDSYVKKVGDFYGACMDEAATEAHGLADLRAEWARIDQMNDPAQIAAALAWLHDHGVFPAFALGSDQDAKDATQVIAVVAQGGLSLPDRDYYLKDDPATVKIRTAFEAHVKGMLGLAGLSPAEAGKQAERILGFERALAGSHWTVVEVRDPERTYHRVELAGLEKLAPRFPWKLYLARLGRPKITAISVTTPQSVEELNRLLVEAPVETWRAYFKWHLLSSMAKIRALPAAFVAENFTFVSQAFTGATELEPRWKRCVRLTDEVLSQALGETYVRIHFGGDSKQRALDLVAQIERAMGDDLRALSWMDAPTRTKALEKLARVSNKIGYPDTWRNYDKLKLVRSSFLRSVLAANQFEVQRDLRKIGRPLDRRDWDTSPATVNAFYQPTMNEMTFPAGILQPPLFNRDAPLSVNYGSIGMVMGHELTHGFDDEGRRFDAEGNLHDWWTAPSAGEFQLRAQCVAKQYDGYLAVGDVHLNGQLTLGENLADLGGTKLAHSAFRAAAARKKVPEVAGFTPDQQFFLGLAQAWCTKAREPYTRMLAATDPHSPSRYRVNGPLSNLPEFADAFRCAAGKPMVRPPAERCAVW